MADVGKDHDQSRNNIDNRHDRNDLLRHGADALDAAEEDQCNNDCHNDTDDQIAERELRSRKGDHVCTDVAAKGIDSGADALADGLYLRGVADTERGKRAENAEEDAQPAKAFPKAVLDIVHRAAYPVALIVAFAILNGKRNLGEFRAHAEQGGKPHPEDGTRTADHDSAGDAGDIAGADSSCQSGGESLKRRNLAFTGFLFCEDFAEGILHGVTELAELQKPRTDTENNADAHQQAEHDRTPCNIIQFGNKLTDCHKSFLLTLLI